MIGGQTSGRGACSCFAACSSIAKNRSRSAAVSAAEFLFRSRYLHGEASQIYRITTDRIEKLKTLHSPSEVRFRHL